MDGFPCDDTDVAGVALVPTTRVRQVIQPIENNNISLKHKFFKYYMNRLVPRQESGPAIS